MHQSIIFAGLAYIRLPVKSFDLGYGVSLNQTYAHLMAHSMVAFEPPPSAGVAHPAPWVSAGGGYTYDIFCEMHLPEVISAQSVLTSAQAIRWLVTLIRLIQCPFVTVAAISNQSFSDKKKIGERLIEDFGMTKASFVALDESQRALTLESIEWIKDVWISGYDLVTNNHRLVSAMAAFDVASVSDRPAASLIAVWGGLEQIFLRDRGELRYRVATNIATFLEPAGEARYELFKKILKLYDQRSAAAHSAAMVEETALIESFLLMRRVLVKIINLNFFPSADYLERRLFAFGDQQD